MKPHKKEKRGALVLLAQQPKNGLLFGVLRRYLQPMQPIRSHWKGRSISSNMIKEVEGQSAPSFTLSTGTRVRPILATHPLRAQSTDTGMVAQTRVAESAQHLQLTPEAVIAAFEDYNSMI